LEMIPNSKETRFLLIYWSGVRVPPGVQGILTQKQAIFTLGIEGFLLYISFLISISFEV